MILDERSGSVRLSWRLNELTTAIAYASIRKYWWNKAIENACYYLNSALLYATNVMVVACANSYCFTFLWTPNNYDEGVIKLNFMTWYLLSVTKTNKHFFEKNSSNICKNDNNYWILSANIISFKYIHSGWQPDSLTAEFCILLDFLY